MTEHDVQPAGGEYPTRRPGHELCAARERAGISREDIARTLRLPQEQVDALEADQYARLPPPAYVRGYLRAYAREVGMDPDQIVADYDAIHGEADDPALVVHPRQPDAAGGHGPTLALAVVVAVALVGAVAWWLQQPALSPVSSPEGMATEAVESALQTEEPAAVEPAAPEEPAAIEPAAPEEPAVAEPAEPAAPEAPAEEAAEADATGAVEATAVEETAETGQPASSETAVASGDAATRAAEDGGVDEAPPPAPEPTAADTEAPETAVEGGESAAVEAGEPTMVAEGDRPTATSQAELVPTVAATQGPDTLVVDIDGRSWLEVFDARGRQLAYTLYSGDEPVELDGWAPFEVFLGNAPDVTLRFEEREIDHSAFVRSDNTARFLVDAEGARRR